MAQSLPIYETLKARTPDIDTPNFRGWSIYEDRQARVIFWEVLGRAPAHIHQEATHYFTVLSGRVLGAIEGKEYQATPGTGVVMPRGKRHTHRALQGEVCLGIDTTVPPVAWEKTVWVEQ